MKKSLRFPLLLLYIFFNINVFAQQDKTMYVFGHSLIVHATSSDETTVPHWVYLLAEEAGSSVSVSGQYGFLPQHDNLPPIAQWGFDIVTPAWDSDTQNFSEANFDTILLTAGNFVQGQPSNMLYYGDPDTSPLSATLTILDWIENEAPNAITYIYENWPDMAPFIAGESFPPSVSEFQNYNTYTEGDFHDWWIEYHDFVQAERPTEDVRMIPVGPILSKLLSQSPLNQIPILDLYEDNAPHGRPTLYFLASLITYMAIYEEKAPVSFNIPNTVNALVENNFQNTIDFIWGELLRFNDTSGNSRVFVNSLLSVSNNESNQVVNVRPNPTKGKIVIDAGINAISYELYDLNGRQVKTGNHLANNDLDITNISKGLYLLKIKDGKGKLYNKKIVKE
ncbi:T9SS type A sorting domain-containing protein [Flavivirga rizhaonensis]|uniref:T9SS type A sorting domain-containing protein n=1 Tax=Flavivirga rizhaonensis TaxID=2559571 RepID=A0A4S1E1T7_9FLAO|nr:T9SS type A sorting domain-containing protein [Flavivirga rizhaonensis]TGV04651.1 T9SS type A sorting domain-containing protein [Flavivirga rizhaonensis]